MKIKSGRLLMTALLTFLLFSVLFFPAYAQSSGCTNWLPSFISAFLCNENPIDVIQNRVQVGFIIAFGVVILIAVAYVILASIKFIRSKGESGEMEASSKSMQAIFYGVGAIFVGVLGIALVILFFNPSVIFPSQICIQAPDSVGCLACSEGLDELCNECEDDPKNTISGHVCDSLVEDSELDEDVLLTQLETENEALED